MVGSNALLEGTLLTFRPWSYVPGPFHLVDVCVRSALIIQLPIALENYVRFASRRQQCRVAPGDDRRCKRDRQPLRNVAASKDAGGYDWKGNVPTR